MRIWCGLLCLLLATWGCVAASVEKKPNPFVGQPVAGLVAKLGLPDDEKTFDNGTELYIWSTSYLEGGEYRVSQYQCTIKVAADEKGIIRTIDWTGNFGALQGCMDALAPSVSRPG